MKFLTFQVGVAIFRFVLKRLLLHICCGPCAAHAVHELKREYELSFYFYNPNIWPEDEYRRRLDAARVLAHHENIELIIGRYEPVAWETAIRGFEGEPEGGRRCRECFRLRLDATAVLAFKRGFDCFTSVLTTSPHKDAALIQALGVEAARRVGREFLQRDFRCDNGFRKSVEASRALGLYRQAYCGCKYSFSAKSLRIHSAVPPQPQVRETRRRGNMDN